MGVELLRSSITLVLCVLNRAQKACLHTHTHRARLDDASERASELLAHAASGLPFSASSLKHSQGSGVPARTTKSVAKGICKEILRNSPQNTSTVGPTRWPNSKPHVLHFNQEQAPGGHEAALPPINGSLSPTMRHQARETKSGLGSLLLISCITAAQSKGQERHPTPVHRQSEKRTRPKKPKNFSRMPWALGLGPNSKTRESSRYAKPRNLTI
jgi:hypothetical protein